MIPTTTEDDELLEHVRCGEPDAFAIVHRRYAGELEAYARAILGQNHALAEDVVQEAFLKTHRAVATGRTILLRPWLYRLVRNGAVDELRRMGNHCVALDPRLTPSDAAADPWQVLDARWVLRDVLRSVAALPHRQRDALLLHAVHGVGHEQVARRLGVTAGASKALVHRARSAL